MYAALGERNAVRCCRGNIMQEEHRTSEIKSKKRSRKPWIITGICLVFFAFFCAGGWAYVYYQAYQTVRVEAGIRVEASAFMINGEEAFFTQDSQPFDITVPGEYEIKVKSGLFTHNCRLVIEDTIAPAGESVPVQLQLGETCGPEAFVRNIEDATRVTVAYVEEPDFDRLGVQEVKIALTDRGENRTVLETELFLIQLAESVTVEVGGEAPGLESFVIMAPEASFITEVDKIDYTRVGEWEVLVDVSGEEHSITLYVTDTVPPLLELQDIEGYALLPRAAEDFVVRVEDASPVEVKFVKEPDLTKTGSQVVEVAAVDESGNETVKQAALTLYEDTEAPVIQGAADFIHFVGENISYRRNVRVSDNSGEEITLEIDSSGVNLGAEGVYPVVYTAKDRAGNIGSVTVNLTVMVRRYTLEEVNALADLVLAQIITPDMSDRDKAWAIYSYVISHVAYISHEEKGDWIKAAYKGLAESRGDCYTYACTAKALLTRAGIANMDIQKIPSGTEHYWNLVDVGDGWYHFDTTPRTDHPTIFLWTEAELMEYSAQHWNAFNYDHSLYPAVN